MILHGCFSLMNGGGRKLGKKSIYFLNINTQENRLRNYEKDVNSK